MRDNCREGNTKVKITGKKRERKGRVKKNIEGQKEERIRIRDEKKENKYNEY